MGKDRKIKLALAFIALIICIIQISQTYAKYLDSKQGETDFNIARWKILVNNQDITTNATMSSLINPVYTQNNNVADGVIAPGSEGYFDLNIDATQTDVSFNYTITVGKASDSVVTDLIITGYQINNGSIINTNSVATITNSISYNATNKTTNLRIYFKWKEGTGENMDNASDTQAAVNQDTAKLTVNIQFIQVAN